MPVSVVLVSHNGARWLPHVLDGIEAQTHRPDHLIAVDTGSRDGSSDLLRQRSGWDIERLSTLTPYAESVAAGVARIPAPDAGAGDDPEPAWVWLLHDDSAPAPDALAQLLAAAREHPEAQAFGPKIREWPSLLRMLEVGVTISGTGRRETGLERGEYDQGQHDDRRIVLAVNTAGMLVRRDVLDELGLDPALPVFATDVDLGWRLARAGGLSMVVPEAVVFHVEAAAHGLRRSRGRRRYHREERAAAAYTLLANCSRRELPGRALVLALAGLLRAIGYLLVRRPGRSWAEVSALASTLGRPGRIREARRHRERTAQLEAADVRYLLAPPWLPLRHVLDGLSDFAAAGGEVVRDNLSGRRLRAAGRAVSTSALDEDTASAEPTVLGLLVRNGHFWLALGSVVLALVAGRSLLAGGHLQGGALLPAPGSVGHWWSLWSSSQHLLGAGSSAPAPAYVLPLALVGTVLAGQAGWVLSLLFVLLVPLAALSALRFLRRIAPASQRAGHGLVPLAGAFGYALLPVASGAVAQGRLGTVAAAVVLPWVATSALRITDGDADRRWRAVWRTALGLSLLVAFVPAAWLLGAALALALLGERLVRGGPSWRRPTRFLGPVAIVLTPLLLCLPWTVATLRHPRAWLPEAGWLGYVGGDPAALDLLLGRAGGPGAAPVWLGAGLVVAGLLAGLRADTRSRVARAWGVAAVAAVLLTLTTAIAVELPGLDAAVSGRRAYPGFWVLVVQASLVTAAVVAADGLAPRLRGTSWRARPGLRRATATLAGAAAAVALLGTAAWWLVGTGGPLGRGPLVGVPSYMAQLSAANPADGVLVLRGSRAEGISYQLFRAGPLRTGDDGVLALTSPDPRLTATVARLVADPQPEDERRLGGFGVAYVFAPAPVSPAVSGSLDAAAGFSRASAPTPADASWRLQDAPTLARVSQADQQTLIGPALLRALQLVLVLAAVVLAVPTRRGR